MTIHTKFEVILVAVYCKKIKDKYSLRDDVLF